MNISEVSMLSDNLWDFYDGVPYSYLGIQIEKHGWFLDKDIITEISPYTPQQLSKVLFYWVFE